MRQGSFRAAGTASFVFLVGLLTAEAAPTVTSFTPVLGKPGTQVVISGSGFSTATQVKFDTAANPSPPGRRTTPTEHTHSLSSILPPPRTSCLTAGRHSPGSRPRH